MKAIPALAVSLALAGCAAASVEGDPPVRPHPDSCNPAGGQNFLGQRVTEQTGSAILAATGATRLRWVPPRTAVTMEFAYGRVTVSYDDDYRITRVTCG